MFQVLFSVPGRLMRKADKVPDLMELTYSGKKTKYKQSFKMYLWQGNQEDISEDISLRPKSKPGEGVREEQPKRRKEQEHKF